MALPASWLAEKISILNAKASPLKKYFKEHRKTVLIFLIVIIGFALYANSFGNKMFWDDDDSILKNQYIKDWQYIPKYFSENLIAGSGLLSNYWRPVLLGIFSIEWHLWEDWAQGYHFINASFHIAGAILLFFILLYVFKKRWLAFLTALIFLVHPLQTEAVTYVSGLGDPLSAFFVFSGIFFYLRFRISSRASLESAPYFLSLFGYILSLMSKETAIIAPFLIIISDFFFLMHSQKENSPKENLTKIGKAIWPFFVIAGAYIILRATLLNFQNTFNLYNEENIFTSNFSIRLFTFFRVLTVYFGLLFGPLNLHMERSVEIAVSPNSFSVIFGGFIFLGLLALAAIQFRRFPVLSFGVLWFFIGLAPVSNLMVPISGLLYEHWLYLPSIGIFLSLVWIGTAAAKKYNLEKIFGGIFIIFLIAFCALTLNRNKEWRDPVVFYNQTLKYAPTSYRVINNLGMAYADKGDNEEAEKTYKKAIAADPSNPVAYHNLGNVYRAIGKIDLAIENFNAAIRHDPKFSFSYNALASLYLESKNYHQARKILESYIDYSQSKIDTLFLLAQVAAEEKDFNAALDYLEKALALDPQNQLIKTSIIQVKNLIEREK